VAGTKIFEKFFVPAMACLGKNCFPVEKFRKCDLTPVQVDFFSFLLKNPLVIWLKIICHGVYEKKKTKKI
jgi:hypothetical protein